MANLPTAPAPRPAQTFTTARAQQWVLASAIVVAVVYVFRSLVEPAMTTAPAKGSKVSAILGAGSPPPALGTWAISYGAGFIFLAVISLAAPELAATLALMTATGSLLANGQSVASDLANLEHSNTTRTVAGTATPSDAGAGHQNLQ
jgi:hypothetical protein